MRIKRWLIPGLFALAQAAVWVPFFSGAGMRAVVAWVLLISLVPLVGGLMLVGAIVFGAVKRRWSAPVLVTAGLSLVALWPGAWNMSVGQLAFPASLANTKPSLKVRLPTNQPMRVLWGGDRLATNYHAFTPDQRWAYDLGIAPYLTGSKKLEDYGCWGTEVVAPLSAKVHLARDESEDNMPGVISNDPEKVLGNTVVLETKSHTFLILAHLQHRSLRVKTGDTVREGEVIGLCGNSGHTSEPHVHIHHQRQDPAVFPNNFAEGLPLYFRDTDGPAMPEGGIEARDGGYVGTGALIQHRPTASD